MTQAGGLLTKYCKMLTGWTGPFAGFPLAGDRVVWRRSVAALDDSAVVVVSCNPTFYDQQFALRDGTGFVVT